MENKGKVEEIGEEKMSSLTEQVVIFKERHEATARLVQNIYDIINKIYFSSHSPMCDEGQYFNIIESFKQRNGEIKDNTKTLLDIYDILQQIK